ncbi:MAG: TRAP transporter large permease [Burkholderiaceae bacterium]|jgi:tripartite ATP-independent transporter DctM subunit|nr:TRAP transporter large permease [Burkholderiales bacterium]MCZ8105191.1 TRAP transporter large permease [Burkholderiales bacterium]MCZ8338880.1 TRAP transporter large permease [Burkholderiaceae bacterium]
MMVAVLTIGLFVFLLVGVPVALALGMAAAASLLVSGLPFTPTILSMRTQFGLQNFILLGIPLFILAAKLMNTAGITQKIFRFADTLVGFMPGGLAQANVVASLIFSGMSGAAVVDASGLGQVEMKAMREKGYPERFSIAVTAASSIIGPIFPPSVPMIVFSFVSGVSVGRLFLGGVVPGLLMTVALMVMVAWYARRGDYPRERFPGWAIAAKHLVDAFLPLLTPVILLGGIWTGIFTPTEAAAVAVAYALLIGVFAMRELGPRELAQVFVETARESAVIGFVIATSSLFGWVLIRSGLTLQIGEWLLSITTDPLGLLLIINVLLLVVGCFLDSTVALLILTPILLPVAIKLGIDPVHFGVLMVLNLMIGLMTPPFGMILFVLQHLSDLSFDEVVRATAPFLVPLIVVLLLITVFPSLVTALPDALMGVAKK